MSKKIMFGAIAVLAVFGIMMTACSPEETTTTTTTTAAVAAISVELTGGIDVANGSTVDFGMAQVGTAANYYFYVTNTGNDALYLYGVPVVDGIGYTLNLGTVTNIAAKGSTTFRVGWDASRAGTNTCTVTISNSSSVNPFTFTAMTFSTNAPLAGPQPLSTWKGNLRGLATQDTNGTPYTLPELSITSFPYPTDFMGADSIADVKTDIDDGDVSLTRPYTIKAMIVSAAGYHSDDCPQYDACYIQDVTGGIYVIGRYSGQGSIPGYHPTNIGMIIEMTVPTNGTDLYHELYEIIRYTNVTVRAATGSEPTEVYVRDIDSATIAMQSTIVRYAGTIASNANSTFYFTNPDIPSVFLRTDRCTNDVNLSNGMTVTVCGPVSWYDAPQMTIYYSENQKASDLITNAIGE